MCHAGFRSVRHGNLARTELGAALFLICLLLEAQPVILAQGLTGQVSGRIQDASDKPMTGVDIALTSTVTGLKHLTKTNMVGEFLLPEVLPGEFDLHVETSGFKTFEQKGIVLSSGEHLVVTPVTLQIGEVSEVVTINADLATLDTQSS